MTQKGYLKNRGVCSLMRVETHNEDSDDNVERLELHNWDTDEESDVDC